MRGTTNEMIVTINFLTEILTFSINKNYFLKNWMPGYKSYDISVSYAVENYFECVLPLFTLISISSQQKLLHY